MKILYKDLVNSITEKPNINDLSDKLFQLGHEHEIDGNIFNLELTPNRGDCLSLKGILRELNLFYDVNINREIYNKKIKPLDLKFTNNSKSACPKISFLKIDIDSIPKSYTNELENYFKDLDIKKNNFFTDISNYLSYETGQPTHCYQASKIDELKLDFSTKKQKFETLLDKTIEVDSENLVFLDKQEAVINLAGVVGGMSTSCDKNTQSVLIECAYFNPEVILGKAVKYSINSDAAHKFERNVDWNCHDYVLRRFIKIVEEHTNILNLELCSNVYQSLPKKVVDFDLDKINKILGTDISKKTCIDYLESLQFVYDQNQQLIHVPTHRNDISNINDISEEIARSIGYNNIEPNKFNVPSNINKVKINDNLIKIKNLLIDNGFFEVINDPFTSLNNKNSIEVDNPLDTNRRFLRTSLKNSLLENLLYNERRQQDSIKLFEIADIYSLEKSKAKTYIGIIITGRVDNNYEDFSKKLDKKYLVNIIDKHINANVEFNYEIISRDNLKSKSKNVITYLEIELDQLFNVDYLISLTRKNKLDIKYSPVSDYPSSTRDLSFSIKDYSKSEILQNFILNFENEILKDIFIFDYFFNKNNAEIKIGFRFVFQSNERTITEQEVKNIMNLIIEHTGSIKGVNIPGLN